MAAATHDLPVVLFDVGRIERDPLPLAFVLYVPEPCTPDRIELIKRCWAQSIRTALGPACPPLILMRSGIRLEVITDVADLPLLVDAPKSGAG